jgi:hypothetical protein
MPLSVGDKLGHNSGVLWIYRASCYDYLGDAARAATDREYV